jgi:hypothetical protein
MSPDDRIGRQKPACAQKSAAQKQYWSGTVNVALSAP